MSKVSFNKIMSQYFKNFAEENSKVNTIFEYIKYLSLFPFRACGHISLKRIVGEDVDYKSIFWGSTFSKIGSSFCCLCIPFIVCYDQVLLKDIEEIDAKFQRNNKIDSICESQGNTLALAYGTFEDNESDALNQHHRASLITLKDTGVNQSLRDLMACNRITKKTFGTFL